MRLWGGAFNEPSDQDLQRLNDSIGFDKRMAYQDIQGSIAYALAIAQAGVITAQDAERIVEGLKQVLIEFESGSFVLRPGDEDIHTAVERRLMELIGPLGGRLHTGRSRNDQVATDFRLWTMRAIDDLRAQIRAMQVALIEQAQAHIDWLMPGYTHLQPAQPITVGHWLMSFFWMLKRDDDRLEQARRRTAVSPLGSGALAGTPFAIDREALAEALGFAECSQNSLDAVSDRDFVAEVLFDCALLGTHLSRLAEDLIIYSNPAFGYVTLHDRYSTGSSLMPQKRNPDPMELARGKAGRLIGNLTGLLATLKGLPSAYNKDLQEDKEALFDSCDNLMALMPVLTAVIHSLKLNRDKMEAGLSQDMLATDMADYLVRKGVPFREAHHIVGRAVRLAAEQGVGLLSVPVQALQALCPLFEDDLSESLSFAASVAKRQATGGTAPQAVQRQIDLARRLLS
ncbi:MAG: argininosuccinate lyase [Anaerolineae bacterium]|nr:argininosuccinate lyase [Anaerolineae bacterium]MDW8173290.1 argininosuccinate lyase [Anaerolineae bacterium]